MNKAAIFEDIINIMKNDSSTCKDIPAPDDYDFKEKISEAMSCKDFCLAVNDYLACYGVRGHVAFYCANGDNKGLGFKVRRYNNALYVVKASDNALLSKGDRIIELDGQPIDEAANKYKIQLYGETPERQGDLWNSIIRRCKVMTVADCDNRVHNVDIVPVSLNDCVEPYEYRRLNDDTAYLRFNDFADEGAIAELINNTREEVTALTKLIIDVRGNSGGDDAAYFPLYDYCYPYGMSEKSIMELEDNDGMEINYSKRNCEIVEEQYTDYLQQCENIPDTVKAFIETLIDRNRKNYCKGFVRQDDVELEIGINTTRYPEKIVILTDAGCASSGEAFVKAMSYSPIVTVVGEPTMGILDYSNCLCVQYIDNNENIYVIQYPSSRLVAIDNGAGMIRKGVPVDVKLEWTPEGIDRDNALEKGISILGANI